MFSYVSLDAEYNRSSNKEMNIVCMSMFNGTMFESFWTNQGKQREEIKEYFESLPPNTVLLSFAAEAEASSLISLGIDPLKFKWVDLQLEVKMLYNHNNALSTGKHLIDGREVTLRPFGEKPKTSLASSLYKFLNVKIDTEHKTKMRDIIISCDDALVEENKEDILKYCESDTLYLPRLFEAVKAAQTRFIPRKLLVNIHDEMLLRGEYSVRTALMVRHGTPINMEWAHNLSANIPIVLNECIQDINGQFPDIKPFRFDSKTAKYVMDTKRIKFWIDSQGFKNWQLTDKKHISLALDAWEDHFQFRHDFPRGNFGAQMVRYLKMKQSLNSFNFKQGQKEKTFFDTVGDDGFSRPYMNHFGAQSSRTQPKSSGFLFLKSAWMRAMAQPPKGYAIGAIDYSSQEFLLSAVCSNDPKMIQAYKEGDVYLYYGKGIGIIPPNGTKATHGYERDLCKGTVLGLSYLMTEVGLAKKLTADTGKVVTEAEALKLVTAFDRLFSIFSSWRESIWEHYKINNYIRLPDGWMMFKDNQNRRSVCNMPLQGAGACIMRKAVALAQSRGLTIIFSLHDALYIMSKVEDIESDMDILKECMVEAFVFYFSDKQKASASLIRVDGKIWGSELIDGQVVTNKGFKLESSKLHIDQRAKEEYSRFSKYFIENPSIELL